MGLQLELFREDIIGLRPVYTEMGNGTIIILRSGELEVPQGIRSVVAALARSYAIDLQAQRRQLAIKLKRGGFLPFYLSSQRVFVPLKMRRPLATKDMVYGFIDINYLAEVSAVREGRCMVRLTDQRCIEVLSQRTTVDLAQNLGQRLLVILQGGTGPRLGTAVVAEAASTWFDTLQSIAITLENIEQLMKPGHRYRIKK